MIHKRLERWAVIYLWEQNINTMLKGHYLVFDRLIFIQKLSELEYAGYVSVKPVKELPWKANILYTKIFVRFNQVGRCIALTFTLLEYLSKNVIEALRSEDLIFDKREEFALLLS